jgi:hypothetical protein
MDNQFFGTMLFIALLGCAWNIVALVLSWFGVYLPVADPGTY